MRVIDIALKDFLQIIRDRKALVFLILMPIVFTLFFGFVMSGSISDPRLPVGWINEDGGGALSAQLTATLEESKVVRLETLTIAELERASKKVRENNLAAIVRIPSGFSEGVLAGRIVPITITAMPGSTAGTTASAAIESTVNRLFSAVVISQLSANAMEKVQPFANPAARSEYLSQGLEMANQAWAQPSFTIRADSEMDQVTSIDAKNKGFLQSSPGMIAMFAVLALNTCSMVFFTERKGRTLERMMTTPIQQAQIISGHIFGVFIVIFLQEVLLVAFGQILFNVNYLHAPFGTLLMMVSLALWSACLGMLIGVIARVPIQIVMFTLLPMFLFSALGGAWWPLEIVGKTFATVGHFTPLAWAVEGFQNIVMRGQGFTSTLLPAGMVTIFSIAFFLIALWRFRKETARKS